jgi:predicted enzyme related to lactoylglutathione lyase
MEEPMPNGFFWYDVMTTDPKAAETFYRGVVGWGAQDSGAGSPGYTLFTVNGRGVAGLMAIPEEARRHGVPPAWMGYIYVDDVDEMAARITLEGGKVHKGPLDVPGIIRFAAVSDPQGAGFIIAKPMSAANPPPLAIDTPGTIGWHELYAGEWKSAFSFYEKLFGWTKAEAHDMGAMGTYQLFTVGGAPIGGVMTKPPQVPQPCWVYYINVAAIDAAAERITAAGGTIVIGPMEVPGGQWIVQAVDPQGAGFALLAPVR